MNLDKLTKGELFFIKALRNLSFMGDIYASTQHRNIFIMSTQYKILLYL